MRGEIERGRERVVKSVVKIDTGWNRFRSGYHRALPDCHLPREGRGYILVS